MYVFLGAFRKEYVCLFINSREDLAKRAGHIKGICPHLVPNEGLTHLQYADDTIMMVEGSDKDIQNLKFLLLCFQEMSGLTINFAKSEVMVLGYS